MIEVQNCLQVLSFEIFLLKLHNDLVFLFELMEALAKYFQVCGHFFCRFCFNLTGDPLKIV